MSSALLEFFRTGGLGNLQIGMTRAEVIAKMGSPPDWSGKPPVIGAVILRYEESDVWWYHSNAVGISFDERGISESMVINPAEVIKDQLPFCDWPFGTELRLFELRAWMIEQGVSFQVGTMDEVPYFLIEGRCWVYASAFDEYGRPPGKGQRRIISIIAEESADRLPDDVRNNLLR